MSAQLIYVLGAVIGMGIGYVAARIAIARRSSTFDHPIDLIAINADIEVYDFVNGQEINRRSAYPLAKLVVTTRRAVGAMTPLQPIMNDLGRAASHMFTARWKGTP